ncbi:flagellar hook-basal body complex protein [Methylogaea oryzae]|uniref:flagellar hook-basal body complex protein n=1 Tax=Methylogaea oryzae TaxID=1295382 RepID=UPI000AB2D7A4|nr:flagellar hook-basal body complex protein [Methylogaea oryzae]
MTFTTGLSGLSAAQNMLSVTSNNLANAQTAGFKQSRSEFQDVYSTTVAGVAKTTPGAGGKVGNVAQQFTQGNLNFTENSLDLAVSGEGFFVLGLNVNSPNARSFTRDGQFHVDDNGYVVNNTGNVLMAYKPNDTTNAAAGFSTGLMNPLRITTGQSQPKATSSATTALNLNSSLVANGVAGSTAPVWNAASPTTTADYQTSVTVYDSQGGSHTLSSYYKKQAAPGNTWNVYYAFDGATPANNMGQLTFNSSGALTTVTSTNANVTATTTGLTITAAGIPLSPAARRWAALRTPTRWRSILPVPPNTARRPA